MSLDELRADDGTFRILAIDHRDSLRWFLSPDEPDAVAASLLTDIKSDLARAITPFATGVMLEPEYSIPQLLDAGAVAPGVGFIAALEAQGYLADPGAGVTTLLDGWSAEQAAASGAAAAKLLLPFHPDHPLADDQVAVARDVLATCRAAGLPLVLEPLFFGLSSPAERPGVVLATVDRFAELQPDLLKLPFPVDVAAEDDDSAAADWCAEITARCSMPWALLSGGGSFDDFARQVRLAVGEGGAGFMVGRALWGEAARAPEADRAAIIRTVVVPRWHQLCEIVDTHR